MRYCSIHVACFRAVDTSMQGVDLEAFHSWFAIDHSQTDEDSASSSLQSPSHGNCAIWTTDICWYAAILTGCMKGLAIRPSLCLVWAHNSKTKGHGDTKIGVKVPRARSNWCANLQLRRWKIRFRVRANVGSCSRLAHTLGQHTFQLQAATNSCVRCLLKCDDWSYT